MAQDKPITARKPTQEELAEALGVTITRPEPEVKVPEINVLKGIARAVAQGITFGTSDEIQAFAENLFTGKSYDEAVKEQRQKIEQFRSERPELAYPAEIASSMAMPLGIAGTAGRLAGKALPKVGEAVSQAAQKILPQTTLGRNVALGAGTGAAYGAGASEEGQRLSGALAGGAIGAGMPYLAPRVGEAASKLIPKGVKTTIGQTFEGGVGQLVGGVEDVLARMPVVGVAPTSMRQRALRSFDVAAVNEVLEPVAKLGVKPLKTNMEPREAVSQAYKILGDKYTEILSGVKMPSTASIKNAVSETIDTSGAKLTDDARKALRGEVDEVFNKYSANGEIDGEAFKQIQMELRVISQNYSVSPLPSDRNIGKVVSDVSDTFFSELSKINPKSADTIKSLDSAYARFKPIQYITAKSKDESGTFTPSQLLSELSQGGRRQAGLQRLVDVEKPLQQLALDAQSVLPSKIQGSDTAAKELGYGMLGVGVGQGAMSPYPMLSELPLTVAKGILAPMAVYNPLAQPVAKGMIGLTGSGMRSPAVAGLLSERPAGMIPYLGSGGEQYMVPDPRILGE